MTHGCLTQDAFLDITKGGNRGINAVEGVWTREKYY